MFLPPIPNLPPSLMELKLLQNGFDYIRKRKKLTFIIFAVGFSSYGCYRTYHAPFIARKRNKISKLLNSFVSVAEAVSESADTIGIVTKDFKDFLQSDSDQVPNSLNQISKISRSEQFSDSLVSVTTAVTVGVLRGYQSMNMNMNPVDENQSGCSGSTLADQVFDKLFTPAGSGFASVVIGSFARNLVIGFYDDGGGKFSGESGCSGSDSGVPKWVDVVCGDKCGVLIGNVVQLFVSTLVSVYLDKTMHINTYEDFFSGLTNPNHETRVREMLVSVCNGAIESFVKTSHQVFNSSNPNDGSGSCFDIGETPSSVETSYVESKEDFCDEEDKGGWVSKVSSTLAVPSNRKLVLDVTGRVTFETVRSFMEFILQTLCASVRRCAHDVHEAVVEIMRHAAAKFSVIVAICLSLCLHVMDCTWALVPA